LPGTLNAVQVVVDGEPVTVEDEPLVFSDTEQANLYATAQGFADWELLGVTV